MLKYNTVFFLVCYFCLNSVQAFSNNLLDSDFYNNPNKPFYNNLYNKAGYYDFQNNGILNLAPNISFNGLTNRNAKFAINGVDANFLNLPFNSGTLLNTFFISKIEPSASNKSLNTEAISNYININTISTSNFTNKSQDSGIAINSSVSNPNFIMNNNLIGYFKTDNTNILLGINYFYLKNSFDDYKWNNSVSFFNNYNNIISFEYAPLGKDVSFKITNINFLSNAKKDISYSTEAQNYFASNVLKQKSLGNFLSFSYEANPKDNSLWHYSSSIAFNNQKIIFNRSSSLITVPNIDYKEISYKVQNISNVDLFYNNTALTYGVNISKEDTNYYNYNNKALWPAGEKFNYQIYITSNANLLKLDKVYIISGVIFNGDRYKANGFTSYSANNFTPSLELQIVPVRQVKFYASYLYKERLPYVYEKYINGSYFYNNYFVQFVPNYNLKKEKSNQFKGGVNLSLDLDQKKIKLAANISAFYYKIGNYIDYNFLDKNTVQFSNIIRGTLKGYNASLGANIYGWQNQITYTWVKGVDDGGNNLNNLFPSNLVVDSAFAIPSLNIKPGIRARFFNRFSNFNNNYPFSKNKLPGYRLFDVYLEYVAFNNNLSLEIGIENLFNKKYQLPYSSNIYKDRTYFLNFTLKV